MFIPPCLPSPAKRPPTGPEWVHEIKHDGYRLIVRRDGDRIRLYTRRGYNWSGRYPLIVDAVRRLKVRSVILDGEAVVCGPDGRSDFDKLHSQANDDQVVLYAFDLIELDGEDLRREPLQVRRQRSPPSWPKLVSACALTSTLKSTGRLSSRTPAAWVLKGLSRSGAICRIARAGRSAG